MKSLAFSALTLLLAGGFDAKRVVDRMHPHVADQFSKLDEGKFGVSRLPRSGPHLMFLVNGRPSNDVALTESEGREVDADLYVVGNKTAKFNIRTANLRHAGVISESVKRTNYQRLTDLPRAVRASLDQNAELTIGKTTYVTRPIFSDKRCLRCHTSTREGQSVGSVIYTFQRS